MPRHKQPELVARLKGSVDQNPQRYKTITPESKRPLGNAPAHLLKAAQVTWFELEAYALPGVLTGADRVLLEVTAQLLAEFREDPRGFACAKIGQLISCLGRLGMSPADRQKLGVERPKEANPFDKF